MRRNRIKSQEEDKKTLSLFLKNFMFGVEDSLVSTVGLLSGVAAGGATRDQLFLTGIVLIFVEAFSMGVGSYLSEDFTEDYLNHKTRNAISIPGGFIMFFSYFAAGFIPLAPYMMFEVAIAFWTSIFLSLAALFLVGAVSAKLFNVRPLYHGIKMLAIGGLAIIAGYAIGNLVSH